jgi:tRNA synthetases class I (E and Q), catalytic domain
MWTEQTALFNPLYADRECGAMILRIEDTDAERNKPELANGIIEKPIIGCGIAQLDREPGNTFLCGRKAISSYWFLGRPNRWQ